MNGKLLIFGGTYEARIVCERLSAAGRSAELCAATAYGELTVKDLPHIMTRSGRLNSAEMEDLIHGGGFAAVLDATHPYAMEASMNIRAACLKGSARYIRLIREERNCPEAVTVPDTASAASFLAANAGNILLTTGSKELEKFCSIPDWHVRLYARVLPDAGVISHCAGLGFDGAHLIAMQGPFSRELNLALLRQYACHWLVTKNTGSPGGMDEKISAAREAGAEVLLICRPVAEEGLTLEETLIFLGLEA